MGTFEVEFKVRTAHDPVRRRLAERGATARGTVRQVDTYYNPPNRDFAKTDEALRLRWEHRDGDATVRLTYKGPRVDETSKTRIEHEITVGDGDVANSILTALGFDPVAEIEKTRERYHLSGYAVTLDSLPSLGEFVEVETTATEESLADARDGGRALLSELGLGSAEPIRASYLELTLAEQET